MRFIASKEPWRGSKTSAWSRRSGVPVALEDGVRRAVGAGMAIVRAAQQAGIHARVGIDAGPVVAGTVGDWRHSELRLTGEAPAVAKALETRAPAGSVYVSESAHLAVHSHFDSELVGELVVEESARPITAYRSFTMYLSRV